MPIISVVIPTYNNEQFIKQAIQSVLNQTLKDIEIIVVDDGSIDSTRELVNEMVCQNPNIHYYCSDVNKGVAEARNIGVSLSKGNWIAFLDSDDMWTPNKLEIQYSHAQETGAQLVYSGAFIINEKSKCINKIIRVPANVNYDSILNGNDIITSSVLCLRDILRKSPMQRSDLHEDYICWIDILKKGITAVGINEPLVHYRLNDTSKSGNKIHSAIMMWKTYAYLKIGLFSRIFHMGMYTIHGIKRYYCA